MKKVNALVLGLVVLLMVGCGGDDSEHTPTPVTNNLSGEKCQLIQTKYKRGTDPDSLETFIEYNAAGKIAKVTGLQGGISFTQTGTYNTAGQLIKTEDSSGSYEQFDYNTLGLMSKVSYYSVPSSGGPATLNRYKTYDYDSNKQLIKISTFIANQGNILDGVQIFAYPSTNTAKEENYDSSGNLYNTVNYSFDNKVGLGYLHGQEFGLISKHNVLTETHIKNGTTIANLIFTYEYNTEGYPTRKTYATNGVTSPDVNTYTYTCK